MTIFNEYVPMPDEADTIKSSTHREQDVFPDEADRSGPLTDEQASRLDEATSETRADILGNADTFDDSPRSEWIPPKVRQARKRAALLPKSGHITAAEERLAEVARHGGQPKELADAIADARAACRQAHDVLDRARHPEIPSRPRNAEAKQTAVNAIEDAKSAVDHAVRVSEREDIRSEQYDNLTAGIADAQKKAAKALQTATTAFTEWRNLITGADELARAIGHFGDWHQHKDERSINARGLIGDVRRARDLANTSDPYLSGRYLYDDPTPDGEVPEWTAEALAAGSEFNQNVLWRLRKQHHHDPAAVQTIVARDLRIIRNAPIPALHPKPHDGFEPNRDAEASWN